MLDSKGFTSKLKKMALSMKGIHADLQELAVFAIHQIYKDNSNQARDLLLALTKQGTDAEGKPCLVYITSDAQRVMQFISDFAPVTIRPSSGTVKISKTRLDHGMVEREESGYPMWYDWTKAHTPPQIKEVDGAAAIFATFHTLMKSVKEGKKKISPDTVESYNRLIKGIDELITTEIQITQKVIVAEKEQEQNQKAAAKAAA